MQAKRLGSDNQPPQKEVETSNTIQTCRFYTYAWLREDGTPYYIGRGCRRRAWAKHRNWSPPPNERVLILKKNLSNEEANRHEIYMISVFGRKCDGGILNNLAEGGSHAANPPEVTRQRMSASQRGKIKRKTHRENIAKSIKNLPRPRWYTDGNNNVFIRDGQIPPGYFPGRSGLKNDHDRGTRIWWTNGSEEVWRKVCPEGWRRGRKMR